MVRPDVVKYLKDNLPQFPVETLRAQLAQEGVTTNDFDQSLAEALRGAQTRTGNRPAKSSGKAAKLLLGLGIALIVAVGLYAVSQKTSSPAGAANKSGSANSNETGFVGNRGWVVRLPKDYVAMSDFKDSTKKIEIVHFARRGTDPTNFLNEGLFGQMGIIRLTVAPNEFPNNATGATLLANAVTKKMNARGEKFSMKNTQIGSLPGVQVNVQSPFPRVEAYILGQRELYFFYAGQEDEIWRDIVLSLRDTHSEN